MDTIQKTILVIHTLIALGIIVLVLLQRGKGADAGAAFGAGASGTVFGARGSGSFFSRMTAILATAFFLSSLTLAYLSSQRTETTGSVLDAVPAEIEDVADDEIGQPEEDMPALDLDDTVDEAAGDDADLPELEDDATATDEGQ